MSNSKLVYCSSGHVVSVVVKYAEFVESSMSNEFSNGDWSVGAFAQQSIGNYH